MHEKYEMHPYKCNLLGCTMWIFFLADMITDNYLTPLADINKIIENRNHHFYVLFFCFFFMHT